MPVVVLVVIHRPLADLDIGEANIDPFTFRRGHHRDLAGLGVELVRTASPIDHVEGGNQIDALESVGMKANAQRVAVGKTEPLVDIKNRGANGLGELHCGIESDGHACRVFGEQQRVVGGNQHIGGLFDRSGLRGNPGWNFDREIRRDGHILRQRTFLQGRVVAHVDGALRLAHHD